MTISDEHPATARGSGSVADVTDSGRPFINVELRAPADGELHLVLTDSERVASRTATRALPGTPPEDLRTFGVIDNTYLTVQTAGGRDVRGALQDEHEPGQHRDLRGRHGAPHPGRHDEWLAVVARRGKQRGVGRARRPLRRGVRDRPAGRRTSTRTSAARRSTSRCRPASTPSQWPPASPRRPRSSSRDDGDHVHRGAPRNGEDAQGRRYRRDQPGARHQRRRERASFRGPGPARLRARPRLRRRRRRERLRLLLVHRTNRPGRRSTRTVSRVRADQVERHRVRPCHEDGAGRRRQRGAGHRGHLPAVTELGLPALGRVYPLRGRARVRQRRQALDLGPGRGLARRARMRAARTRSRCAPRTPTRSPASCCGWTRRRATACRRTPAYSAGRRHSPVSRTWVKGFRNPFRLAQRPGGTQAVLHHRRGLGSLGGGSTSSRPLPPPTAMNNNYGWPCREGPFTSATRIPTPPTSPTTRCARTR